ncbi:tail protein X [Roseibium alexandrii]|uniref:Phage Tail Protein X n=1 Tax=Roseibium alexandrii TaxID=388408 RepID=A0A0M7ANW6_9HYPH|nr:tail protein X [Roseibium alexandrii]CTQ75920.1 Phage Tail Protein X [Roseibium alexandrii]
MPQTVPVRGDNLTADLLLWRIHGVRGQELLEEMLELNPGLAAKGVLLVPGDSVIVPDLPPEEPFAAREVVTLFG